MMIILYSSGCVAEGGAIFPPIVVNIGAGGCTGIGVGANV
jgi:hypothetical protein